MLRRLKWAAMALSQEAATQHTLFPSFVVVADELALNWEEALRELDDPNLSINEEQRSAIAYLDALVLAISGPEKLEYWSDEALSEFREWKQIRVAASQVLLAFNWPVGAPAASSDIYIGPPKH